MNYDSTAHTEEHIRKVQAHLGVVLHELRVRAEQHDASKLEEPEKSGYDTLGQLLHSVKYGTPEYYSVMNDPRIKGAIEHHVKGNSHHPEAHQGGVNGMSLLDLIELFCDWKAASERGGGRPFVEGLEINYRRFGFSTQLVAIFDNTVKELGW